MPNPFWVPVGGTVSELGEGEEARIEEVERLVDEVASLQIQSVLGTEELPEYGQESAVSTVVMESEGADASTYVLSQPEDESYYVLKSTERPEYLKVADYSVRDLLDLPPRGRSP